MQILKMWFLPDAAGPLSFTNLFPISISKYGWQNWGILTQLIRDVNPIQLII